jgi:arginine/serine-rich splicing factor 12
MERGRSPSPRRNNSSSSTSPTSLKISSLKISSPKKRSKSPEKKRSKSPEKKRSKSPEKKRSKSPERATSPKKLKAEPYKYNETLFSQKRSRMPPPDEEGSYIDDIRSRSAIFRMRPMSMMKRV